MTSAAQFNPDWVTPPGATIVDVLKERGWSLHKFSEAMALSEASAADLLNGAARIDARIALRLSEVIGGSKEFWLAREARYRNGHHAEGDAWLNQLPVREMRRLGWIESRGSPMEACLAFFGIRSVTEWRRRYATRTALARFRTSKRYAAEFGAVVAWLRRGEIEARRIQCGQWDGAQLSLRLPEMRALTREKSPEKFLPKLQDLCAQCGVAVVIVRAPPGCPASGAARFVTQELGLIQLSFRYLSDDQFWFTFFHEIGHLLLHPGIDVVESADGQDAELEREADRFAADLLVPPHFRSDLRLCAGDYRRIIRFARRIGTSPGVVVGQLQHAGVLTYRQRNFLKRRYSWQD